MFWYFIWIISNPVASFWYYHLPFFINVKTQVYGKWFSTELPWGGGNSLLAMYVSICDSNRIITYGSKSGWILGENMFTFFSTLTSYYHNSNIYFFKLRSSKALFWLNWPTRPFQCRICNVRVSVDRYLSLCNKFK